MGIPGSVNLLLLASQAGDYEVSRSVRFNSSDSAYLSRTPASAGNRKTWTWAGWVKRCKPGQYDGILEGGTSNPTFVLAFRSSDDLVVSQNAGTSAGWVTSAVFRDPSAWYHIVVVVDTTSATGTITNSSTDRIRLYVNGVQQTLSGGSVPTQNSDLQVNNTVAHSLGRNSITPAYSNCYLADVHLVDGQALTPSSFTEVSATTGQLIPKAYTGSYNVGAGAVNGFHLPFSDNSTAAALGTDTSGNGNTWTVNNISVAAGAGNDSLVDTPTSYGTGNSGGDVRGNYCTWNPLDKSANTTLANGNLDCTWAAASGGMKGTIGISSGKWYWEITVGANTSVGLIKSSIGQANSWPGDSFYGAAGSYAYAPNGQKVTNSSYSAYGSAHVNGDVIGVAYDADNGKLFFSRNGTWQASGDPAAGTNAAFTSISGEFSPGLGYWTTPTTNVNSANFGQRPFAYTAPSGFKALCDTNLPAPVVAQPSTVMDVVTYTGNNSGLTISGLNLSPDFIWFKARSYAGSHALVDIVRGADKQLNSNLTNAESTNTAGAGLQSFNSDGFTLGTESSATGSTNGTQTYVAWMWDAGTTTASNPDGSITSSVRANPTAGFSIVTYTGNNTSGATVGHGLNAKPSLIICKRRENNAAGQSYWQTYHTSLGATKTVWLNLTDAAYPSSTPWNNTEPSSTVFTLGSDPPGNPNGDDVVAYCFAPVAGYSSFGSYTGNGSTDGPFVYTGFRPRWIMFKCSSDSNSWQILDASRDSYNEATKGLFPNLSNAEISNGAYDTDILSNGFKLRTNDVYFNGSGKTFIYAAFAESPFQYARAR